MKYLLALLSLLFLVAAATAFDGYPPSAYQGAATVLVEFVPISAIPKTCGYKPPPRGRYMGCTLKDRLVLPNPNEPEFHGQYYDQLVSHELGHWNGWPADHPDAKGHRQGPVIDP